MHTSDQTTDNQRGNKKRKAPRPLTLILLALAIIALLHFIAVTHTSGLHPFTGNLCKSLIETTDYTKIIPHITGAQEMSAVQFSDTLTGGQPSALIRVNDSGSQQSLDVYIYTCILQQQKPTLVLLFKQQGLIQGSAEITQANTLSIGQLDTTLSPVASTFLLPQQANVYQEYTWQNGTFQQTIFPGLYPVVSRSEAQALQQEADNGQPMIWQDPVSTSEQMAHDLFKWKQSNGVLQDNNGNTAHVLLQEKQPAMTVIVSLSRIIQHDAAALWFVTSARTAGITIQQNTQSPLSPSPFTIQGTISPAQSQLHASLFDHALNTIPVLDTSTIQTHPNGTYMGSIAFGDTFQDQPGLLLLQAPPTPQNNNTGLLLLTNLLIT